MDGTQKASNFAPKDFISKMPDNVITNILDRLPLQVAVRTDILSRNWRFKWTMLSRLVLDDNFFKYLSRKEDKYNHLKIISRLLLYLTGAITKCVISINNNVYYESDVEEFNHWILSLSRNGMTDLTLGKWNKSSPLLKLPSHLFYCSGLKHLKLVNCGFHPQMNSFYAFPNLLSLELLKVQFDSGQFGEFITRCPVLEILKVNIIGIVTLNEIAKLTNLKTLSLLLSNMENMTTTSSSAIFELLDFFPRVEELDLDFVCCKMTAGGAKKRFPTAFPCLKALKLSRVYLDSDIMLSCIFEMFRHFPNLQTLEITAYYPNVARSPVICSAEVDYNRMRSLQLRSAVFMDLKGSENEVCLIKYLLARSPFLKRIVICPQLSLAGSEQLKLGMKLLKLQRAYPVVDIDLC